MALGLSPLSFGSAPIGGLYGPLDADAVGGGADGGGADGGVGGGGGVEVVRRALEVGMTYIDTAPHYGAGTAERVIGEALKDVPRESFTISTKVGRLLRPRSPGEAPDDAGFPGEPAFKREWDFSGDGIRRSLESSLERLGLDRVDVVYLHDPDDHEGQVYAEAYPALARLRDEGVVDAIGAGMNQAEMLTRFVRRLDLDLVLCAGRYTLLDRSAEAELLPACLERGTKVVIGGVFNSGLLAGGTTYDYAPASPEILLRVARLSEICDSYDVPLRAAAMRFPFRHPAVVSVLTGCRTPGEADDNARLFEWDIPEALWGDLE